MRYATALLIDMSIGPIFSSGPQVWRSHSWDGSNFVSSGSVCANATDGSVSASKTNAASSRFTSSPRLPKYVARPTPSSAVNAMAYRSAAAMPTDSFETVTMTSTMPTSSPRDVVPIPRIPAAARLSGPFGRRVSTAAKISDATQRTAASAQPFRGQPAIAKIGSASAMIVPPATVGAIRLGSGRGVENMPVLMSRSARRPGTRRSRREGSRPSHR